MRALELNGGHGSYFAGSYCTALLQRGKSDEEEGAAAAADRFWAQTVWRELHKTK